MRYKLVALLTLVAFTQCTKRPAKSPRDMSAEVVKPRRTEILFLGDNGHHKPIERVPQLMAALGNRGINITYTDRLDDLNPETLAKYDGLLIYANWDSIPKPQEKALLDYVAAGHGLIPVHCASWCFRNSPEYVKAVGGQFWKHTMDTIRTRFTQPNSPITAGLEPFSAYDETYLHQQVQPDNNVLAVRPIRADQEKDRPGQQEEPYTWTRTYGNGRVFYTAYGHDERTWSQPGFHQLLERGILWAVGDRVKKLHDDLNPQPFQYAEAKLPNYEKRPGPQLRQAALSPEESLKHIQVPVDFTLDLFAHEPNVMHPIAMAWDERGRLFVLITKDYPNERKPSGAGSDYIVICEDTNGDGRADKFTNFAEGLSIPTGMVFANGGLIVAQAPHMLFLRDTNGDDRADETKILFTGFGTFDTHAGPSNLHYGFDNWIWGSVGYAGFKGKVGPSSPGPSSPGPSSPGPSSPGNADTLQFGQGFFRFKADGSQLEYVTSTSNNTWGLAFNETGDVFGSTANNAHGWYTAIPHRYYKTAPGVNNGSRSTDTHKDMKPITGRVRQVDVFGGFTAAAGHNFYTARAFPKPYWNRVAFVAEPTGHILHQNVMEKQGTDFSDVEPTNGLGFNLLAGADEWVSPVFAQVGPDGAVWVADWYSFIIQHNPTPQGFDNGPGNAYQTDLRDYTHGRIYRIGYKNAPVYAPMALRKDRPQELVAALKNPNMFWRMHAQRLLVERGQQDVVPQLLALVNDQSVDEIGINPAAIHALWTLHGLNVVAQPNVANVVARALKHPCAGVRKTAVQVLPRSEATATTLLAANTLADTEPLVVLNTLLAMTELPQRPDVQQAILDRLAKATEVTDRWLPEAFAVALNSHNGQLLKTYLKQTAQQAPAKATDAPADHSQHAMPKDKQGRGPNPPAGAFNHSAIQSVNKPDLAVAAIRVTPESPEVRQGAKVEVDVTNAGDVALPAGTPVPLSLRIEGPTGATDPSKIDYVSVAHNTGIKPGETVTISKGNNGPWNTEFWVNFERAGAYAITAQLDRDNVVAEGNEGNNSATHTLTYRAPRDLSALVIERASRSYASTQPADSVIALLRTAQKLGSARSAAVLKGVSEGWNPKKKAPVSADDRTFLASLDKALPDEGRTRLNRLLTAWGLRSADDDIDPNAEVVRIKTVREAMAFDKKTFTVTPGKTVVLILENPDAMQHNLVIGKPKSLDVIGNAADKLITAKDGAEKNYVPSIPQVIAATPLVNPDQTYRLTFKAPAQPGDYPFVCTFPGHWRIMNGVMNVQTPAKLPTAAK